MLRKVIGLALIAIGIFPVLRWAYMAFVMLRMGSTWGWLSERFLDYEGQSFVWCAAAFAGIFMAMIGATVYHRSKEGM